MNWVSYWEARASDFSSSVAAVPLVVFSWGMGEKDFLIFFIKFHTELSVGGRFSMKVFQFSFRQLETLARISAFKTLLFDVEVVGTCALPVFPDTIS